MAQDLIVGGNLSDRKKIILRSIIESHITNGEPVGSKTLMSASIPYSSATIRSEMAELETLGYLEQPHTSAGRVPTALGYRFYVDALMEDYRLTASEILTLNNLLKSKIGELDNVLQSASKLIAALTNYSTVAIKAPGAQDTIDVFSCMYLDDSDFLVVMRLPNGKVKTAHIQTAEPVSPDVLGNFADLLNDNLAGIPYAAVTLPKIMAIEQGMGDFSFLVSPTIKAVYKELGAEESEVHFEGVDKLLEYPEFSNTEQVKKILDMLGKKEDILGMVTEASDDKVNIIIDDENKKFADNSAFVFKKFVVGGKVVGAIGVFGPSRMDYSRVVSTVEYLAKKIETLSDGLLLTDGDSPGDNDDETQRSIP